MEMMVDENRGVEGKIVAVTGGVGFVGSAVCLELLRRGALQVRSFDRRTVSPWSERLRNSGVRCILGDIALMEDIEEAFHGADCVFHLASYGSSGKELIQVGRINAINIDGTGNVVEACVRCGVTRLVFLSACDVVFGRKEIENGDEDLPYLALDEYIDPYGQSKSVAEQWVLKSNGRQIQNREGEFLRTCAIRSALVYGPGEERHLSRIISNAKLGLFLFKIGDPNTKNDWIYVDNLVLALVLASTGLLSDDNTGREGNPQVAGNPVNSFHFLWPLLRNLDYDLPRFSISVPQALLLGKIFEGIYRILHPLLDQWWIPQPLILPAEVYKVGVTHYFSIHRAEEELGYVPKTSPEQGMAATITYFREKKRNSVDGPSIYTWLFCLIGLPGIVAVAWLPDIGPVSFFRSTALFFYMSVFKLRIMSVVFVAAHVGEAVYAWRLARKVDPLNASTWFWQTLALATFSLRFLLKRAKEEKQS